MSQQPLAALRNPRVPPRAGYTRVSAQALAGTARAVAAESFGVDPSLVRAFLRDDAGYLALSIQLPVPLMDAGAMARGTVLERVREKRAGIGEQFTTLTGSLVSRVDVRVTGIVDQTQGRH